MILDVDNTLYPRDSGIMQEIGRLIGLFLEAELALSKGEARALRDRYVKQYGTTLAGLRLHYQIDSDHYLVYVHDIPLEEYIGPNPALGAMLADIPLRHVVYTNATQEYSWRVLGALNVGDYFERVVGIEDVGLRNKLYPDAYERALALLGAQGDKCIMVEDSARNLPAAKGLGITTVLIRPDAAQELTGDADEKRRET